MSTHAEERPGRLKHLMGTLTRAREGRLNEESATSPIRPLRAHVEGLWTAGRGSRDSPPQRLHSSFLQAANNKRERAARRDPDDDDTESEISEPSQKPRAVASKGVHAASRPGPSHKRARRAAVPQDALPPPLTFVLNNVVEVSLDGQPGV